MEHTSLSVGRTPCPSNPWGPYSSSLFRGVPWRERSIRHPTPPAGSASGWTQVGMASWYGEPFHGRQTASGEVYDMEARTGAHPTLPFGTRIRIENLDNGRTATLTINDRGPFVKERIVDVSRRVARELGMLGPGTARVRITVIR